jgi:predicted nucleic acid-binding Zn ribbon protein
VDTRERDESSGPKAESQLNERTAEIVALRDEGMLLWEIAEWAGVTKERIRQILAGASSKGLGPGTPKQVVTRRALMFLGMSAEMRPGSFQRLMAKFGVAPIATKRGRLYWDVKSLSNIEPPKCVVCNSPVPFDRYSRSSTCSRSCSISRRAQYSRRRKEHSLPS